LAKFISLTHTHTHTHSLTYSLTERKLYAVQISYCTALKVDVYIQFGRIYHTHTHTHTLTHSLTHTHIHTLTHTQSANYTLFNPATVQP